MLVNNIPYSPSKTNRSIPDTFVERFFPPKTVMGLIAPMLTLGDIAIIKYYWGK